MCEQEAVCESVRPDFVVHAKLRTFEEWCLGYLQRLVKAVSKSIIIQALNIKR